MILHQDRGPASALADEAEVQREGEALEVDHVRLEVGQLPGQTTGERGGPESSATPHSARPALTHEVVTNIGALREVVRCRRLKNRHFCAGSRHSLSHLHQGRPCREQILGISLRRIEKRAHLHHPQSIFGPPDPGAHSGPCPRTSCTWVSSLA